MMIVMPGSWHGVMSQVWILNMTDQVMLSLLPWMRQGRHQMWNWLEPWLDRLIELWSRPMSYVWISVIIGIIAAVQNMPV
jgi:hypothetical protein